MAGHELFLNLASSNRTVYFPGSSDGKDSAWVRSLGWEDPLEEGLATHSSILAWRIPMDRGAWWATVHEVAKSWTWLGDGHDWVTDTHSRAYPVVHHSGVCGHCQAVFPSTCRLPLCVIRSVASDSLWLQRLLQLARLLCPWNSLCPTLKRTIVIGFRALPDNLGWSHLKIFNLITLANTLFPNKAAFTDS